ncbi:hypothetical protein QAD02_018137 [Eretmocerus hayati]|uniref:Uncharacterized protein n=1 Tax=Eretmocerus hayati TaxID=131215 RepID=A0ACC2PFJ0_9HYME|nr:hypothetical protein QAD02_018137 [Eretmocerus hayati]
MSASTSASPGEGAAKDDSANPSIPTVSSLLNEWGLGEYLEVFTRNKIVVDQLRTIDDKELTELITPLGDRLIFKQKRDEKFNISRKRKSPAGNDQKEATIKVVSPSIFDSAAVLAQLKPLATILKENPLTESIVVNYESKKILTESQRTLIVDAVTRELLKITKKAIPDGDDKNVLDIPNKKKDSKKKESEPSTGRIPNKWRNIQAKLKKDLENENKSGPSQTEEENVEDDELYEEKRKWFEINSALPIDTVLDEFKKFATKRLRSFKSNRNNMKFVFGKWCIMLQPEGHKLVKADYDHLKLTEKDPTIEDWNELLDALKLIFREKKNDANIKALTSYLQKPDVKPDSCVRAQLELMCRFMPPKTVTRPTRSAKASGEETWKASVADCFNSIVAHVKLPSGIEDLKSERNEDIMIAGKPYIITLGAEAKEPEQFYVCADKALYKMDTFFNALKTCFQAYHVFCIDYPPASQHLWLILQKAFFAFTLNEETNLSNVETVVKSLSVLMGDRAGPPTEEGDSSDDGQR